MLHLRCRNVNATLPARLCGRVCDAAARVQSAVDSADPAAVRRENQAWRIWSLKLAREGVRRAAATAPAADDDGLADADPAPDADPDADSDADLDVLPPILPPPGGKAGNPGPGGRQPSVGPALGGPGLPLIRTTAPVAAPGSDADPGGQSPGTALSGVSDQAVTDNPFIGRVDRLYLVLSSVHGLVRGENMELGKDADTGGQVRGCCWLGVPLRCGAPCCAAVERPGVVDPRRPPPSVTRHDTWPHHPAALRMHPAACRNSRDPAGLPTWRPLAVLP